MPFIYKHTFGTLFWSYMYTCIDILTRKNELYHFLVFLSMWCLVLFMCSEHYLLLCFSVFELHVCFTWPWKFVWVLFIYSLGLLPSITLINIVEHFSYTVTDHRLIQNFESVSYIGREWCVWERQTCDTSHFYCIKLFCSYIVIILVIMRNS